jgi:hypothetical protein
MLLGPRAKGHGQRSRLNAGDCAGGPRDGAVGGNAVEAEEEAGGAGAVGGGGPAGARARGGAATPPQPAAVRLRRQPQEGTRPIPLLILLQQYNRHRVIISNPALMTRWLCTLT